jgi:hypothetical protein
MIAHIKGKPTIARYKAGTVFVDHFSDITYVHFQKTTSAIETIEAKEAFEKWSRSHGVNVKHYHAHNGRFAEMPSCSTSTSVIKPYRSVV